MNREMHGKATERLLEHSAVVAENVRELGHLGSDAARAALAEVGAIAGTKIREGKTYLESAVTTRPLRSVAIAIGAGALLGYLFAKKQ